MERSLVISPSPHVKDADTVKKIMVGVILALVPAGISGVYFFGLQALWVILAAILGSVGGEMLFARMMRRPIRVSDGSAIITGLLLAYNVPAEVPLWLPFIGGIAGIGIGKMAFGGLGYNPMNPALIGRAFLMASWPVHMTVFGTLPKGGTPFGHRRHHQCHAPQRVQGRAGDSDP